MWHHGKCSRVKAQKAVGPHLALSAQCYLYQSLEIIYFSGMWLFVPPLAVLLPPAGPSLPWSTSLMSVNLEGFSQHESCKCTAAKGTTVSSATTRLFIKGQIFIFLLMHFFCLVVFTKTKCVHYICLRPFYLNDWILSVKSMDILYFPQSNEKVVSTWTTCLHLLFRFLNHFYHG